MTRQSWHMIKDQVMEKLNSRYWLPGDKLPNEEIMARDFGVARTTLNRALRDIAKEGFLIRRRKAGTFVATHPVRRAVVNIPIIRHEVETAGKSYTYKLLEQSIKTPPETINNQPCLYIRALHYADHIPHALEERWINHHIVSEILDADLHTISANEWLVLNAPFSSGLVGFSAANANSEQAKILGLQNKDAVFVVNRDTWQDGVFVTSASIIYTSTYRVESYL